VLLSLAAMKGASEDELVEHCRAVAAEMPLIGFYLQPAVGGIPLSRSFWARFAALENVVAIKVAPFNRYGTLDVAFGIVAAGAEDRVTLYTGNDDHIVSDLVTPFRIRTGKREATIRFRGGLLGHWSVWTKSAVALLEKLHAALEAGPIPPEILALDGMVTDCNSVIFDVPHNFAGCIPGCHEILRRQGLMRSIACLDPHETLSPGQAQEIDRLYATYPEWQDDAFVAQNLNRWRSS
jgi:dihydrodipicolinate synthase/N-acetylneuraminate lyase